MKKHKNVKYISKYVMFIKLALKKLKVITLLFTTFT